MQQLTAGLMDMNTLGIVLKCVLCLFKWMDWYSINSSFFCYLLLLLLLLLVVVVVEEEEEEEEEDVLVRVRIDKAHNSSTLPIKPTSMLSFYTHQIFQTHCGVHSRRKDFS